jgi:hypothetical protein
LVEATPGHLYRCWYPVGSPENLEIRSRLTEQAPAAERPEGVLDDADVKVDPGAWHETGDV